MTTVADTLLDDLNWRGLIFQSTDAEGLARQLADGPVSLYCGFDPTAESLHVGNLVPLLTLARFQRAGHRPLALVGGSTGQIGDPSGKSAERDFQDLDVIAQRTTRIASQLSHFLDFSDDSRGKCLNNLDWTQGLGVLTFLRDVGKHFSVNSMLARDSIKSRIRRGTDAPSDGQGETSPSETGISFTEFSYMLLQAYDFLHLAEAENCVLQIGGSDQWGNMCSGIDLIRRKLGKDSFALTLPLLTTHDGKKFGKSEKGAVWLDPSLTSPWEFFQFWLNTDDKDVVKFLKLFTFMTRPEIEVLEAATAETPHLRQAQKALARAMTDLVHGTAVREQLELAADALFGKGDLTQLTVQTLTDVARSVPNLTVSVGAVPNVMQLLVQTGLESSNTKANKVIAQGGVSANATRVTDGNQVLTTGQLLHDRFLVLKKGKREFAIVEVA